MHSGYQSMQSEQLIVILVAYSPFAPQREKIKKLENFLTMHYVSQIECLDLLILKEIYLVHLIPSQNDFKQT